MSSGVAAADGATGASWCRVSAVLVALALPALAVASGWLFVALAFARLRISSSGVPLPAFTGEAWQWRHALLAGALVWIVAGYLLARRRGFALSEVLLLVVISVAVALFLVAFGLLAALLPWM